MAKFVFYSWQSDLPNGTNRSLIRRALDAAITELNADLVEAERDDAIAVDQDTQGIPGSPSIAEAILRKIDACDVFIPDVTIVTSALDPRFPRQLPNPNVLIEYGYALARCGDGKMLPVFNEAFGNVADLPFDIRHKRVIRYRAAPTGEPHDRQEARRLLSSQLRRHLEAILKIGTPMREEAAFPAAKAVYGSSSFVTPGDLLGVDADPWAAGSRPTDLDLATGPHMFLRVMPTTPQPPLTRAEAMDLLRRSKLMPLGPSLRAASYGRNDHGAFVFAEPRAFSSGDARAVVSCITQLFCTREIWGIDALSLSEKTEDGRFFIPTTSVEDTLTRSLASYVQTETERLGISGPLRIIMGFSRVDSFRLTTGQHSVDGHIMRNEIVHDALASTSDEVAISLATFFNDYWDAAGLHRP